MTDNDKRKQIIDGALKVFSKHGFHKSSIKMIAKASGINPKSTALIYHYFADKKALLEAVITENTPLGQLPMINPKMREQAIQMPPEIVLPQILNTILAIQDSPDISRLIVLFISEAARMPEVADTVYDVQQIMLTFLTDYLQHQIDTGRLKPHDPTMAARILISTALINVLANTVFTKLAEGFGEREAYIQQVVDIFLNGLRSAT